MDSKLPASSAAGIEPTPSQSGQQEVVLTSPGAMLSTAIKLPPELLPHGIARTSKEQISKRATTCFMAVQRMAITAGLLP